MPYLGVAPNPRENREVDDISSSFNGSNTAFTLQSGGSNVSPGKDTAIIVSLGGVIQNPGTDYTIAASTITFTTAPASGLSFFGVVLAQSIDIETVADNTVTTAKIVDGAVTNAKVNASAAIAGSKISPDFGSQNIATTGSISGAAGTFTGDLSIPDKIVHTGDTHTAMRFTGNDTITFDTGGTSRVQITDSTTDVGNDLSIADTIVHTGDTNTKIRFPAADTVTVETAGSERMRIDSSGRLGVATSSPHSYAIATFNDSNGISLTGSTQTRIVMQHANGGTNLKNFDIQTSDGNLRFRTIGDNNTSVTERLRIQSGGGISFNGDSAAANALDDYEEGTWTPGLEIGGSTSGIAYNTQSGVYTKVGRIVNLSCFLQLSSKGSNSGNLFVTGLPFAPVNAAGARGSGSLGYYQGVSGLDVPILILIEQTGTKFQLRQSQSSAAGAMDDSNISNSFGMFFSLAYITA